MTSNFYLYFKIVVLYALAFCFEFLAGFQPFFWTIYLPLATAANVLVFDILVQAIDFDEIHKAEGLNKSVYITALTILSAGFAIATAVFLR
jgi:hypothetical protein